MSFITLNEFASYTGVRNENTILQQSYIDSAQDIVENYLCYKLQLQNYVSKINGTGTDEIQLKAKPVKTVFKVLINNESQKLSNFETAEEFLSIKDGVFPQGNKNITVVYEAGYEKRTDLGNILDGGGADNNSTDIIDGSDAFNEGAEINGGDAFFKDNKNYIPNVILSSVLRIAALLQSESDQNIGVTSKSVGDSGARTFINTVNFEKYLLPISRYRLLII